VFAIANPEAAIRITYEVYPQVRGTGRDEATALRDDIKTLEARIRSWSPEAGGVTKWGENSEANYQAYLDFLLKNGVIKQPAKAADLITNDLIDDINRFDQEEVKKLAREYKAP
jgi:NitT/TauT family transport system substrate-binding protein